MLSDCVPILGKRRKPYYVIGFSMFFAANIVLAILGRPSLEAILGWVSGEEARGAWDPFAEPSDAGATRCAGVFDPWLYLIECT
jgi:hypothetical protein